MIKSLLEIEPNDMLLKIESILLEEEETYDALESIKIEHSSFIKRPAINKNTFNIFGVYDKSIYFLYNSISAGFKEIASQDNINIEKSFYYISADIFDKEQYNPEIKYDYSSEIKGHYFGFYFTEADANIKYNEKEIKINKNDLFIFEGKDLISFSNISNLKGIVFYISPYYNLEGQYPGKWIPLK